MMAVEKARLAPLPALALPSASPRGADMTPVTANSKPLNDANRLGLDYHHEARRLPWRRPIYDVHVHLHSLEAATLFFEVADLYRVAKVWSMSPLEEVDAISAAYSHRVQFIAVPNYAAREQPDTFTTDWLKRLEAFRQKGSTVCKFWAAPRGREFHEEALLLDSPIRRESMDMARALGYRVFMTHVADPDLWFDSRYQDASVYGTKPQQYEALERVLDDYGDIQWIAAHMAGSPEDLPFVQRLLDRHPNLYVDTAATKWMVRELSRQPQAFREFCKQNPGRVIFGSDIVATTENRDFDLYASRYWALRTLLETKYDGPSPIVDPDLLVRDPNLPEDATAHLRGAAFDDHLLEMVYQTAADRLLHQPE
jgi:hypothetical protein